MKKVNIEEARKTNGAAKYYFCLWKDLVLEYK